MIDSQRLDSDSQIKPPTWLIIAAYLLAIVVSNMAVAHFGQPALILTAWVLIPFDFVARDILHGRWKGRRLWPRMMLLLAVGGAITIALNTGAMRVALASVAAFGLGVTINTILYQLFDALPRFRRMTYSNAVVSAVDSLVFPLLAFGAVSVTLSLAQCLSKALGAVVWAYIVTRINLK